MSAAVTTHLADAELDDLVDGLLDARGRASADAHLAACVACRQRLAATRALLADAARAREAVAAPAELWPLVAAATVHEARLRRQLLRSLRGPLLVGAALLVIATATVTWWLARAVAPAAGGVAAPAAARATSGAPTPPVAPAAPIPPPPPEPGRPPSAAAP